MAESNSNDAPKNDPVPKLPGKLFQTRYRELTASAIIFAILIGIVMNAAITYSGLKIGFTIVGSAIAAVLGFGFLRGVLRRGSILEINISQTVASAVNTSNSGVIFTVPVLFLIGYEISVTTADFWLLTVACIGGALLGTALIIPLRKQMLDIERLRFPSATAVASILKSPGAGPAKAKVLIGGVILGALIYLPTQLEVLGGTGLSHIPGIGVANGGFLADETLDLGKALHIPSQFQLIFAIAPFALGAGYLTGRAGLFVLAGGLLAYLILNPIAYGRGWLPETVSAEQVAGYAFNAYNRPLGIGLLLGGAFMGILFSLPAIREALKSIALAGKIKAGGADELGLKTLGIAVTVGFIFLFLAAYVMGGKPINLECPVTGQVMADVSTGDRANGKYAGYTLAFSSAASLNQWESRNDGAKDEYLTSINAKPGWLSGLPHHFRALFIAIIGGIWIWFAGIIISQCTGMTDWSPISGLALLTVVLVLMLAGTGAVVGAVLIGAALCVSLTLAADMMGDMRTGYLVGALPKRQQTIELIVVGIGPLICMLTLMLIVTANLKQGDIPIGPGTATVAPQAQALQAVITGVQGGEMPYALYGFGAILGALLGLGAFSGLGVLVGLSMYLPFIYIATYGIGCVIQITLAKIKGKDWAEDWGVPFCAGLIVGESVLALAINSYLVLAG